MKAPSPKAKEAAGPKSRRARQRKAAAADGPTPESQVLTPGLAMVEQAVRFTQAAVLDPTAGLSGSEIPTGMQVGASALAEQAGAMMIEDLRAFLQSMEMIMVPAAARALSQSLAGEPEGAATLAMIQTTMEGIATFAGQIVAVAGETKTALS